MGLSKAEKKRIKERADKFLAENQNKWSWFGRDDELDEEGKKEKERLIKEHLDYTKKGKDIKHINQEYYLEDYNDSNIMTQLETISFENAKDGYYLEDDYFFEF